jgi:cytochrome c553
MEWCLACHRNPEPILREQKDITNMQWKPGPDQAEKGRELFIKNNIQKPEALTSCSTCHR